MAPTLNPDGGPGRRPEAAPAVSRFPFTAIVGQDAMKRALLLNAVDPGIGGVLVRGGKGTAKSTTVRALAALLPPIIVVAGCPYSCDPGRPARLCPRCDGEAGAPVAVERPVRIVELPVGATEDRVVGSLDVEAALRTGVRAFEPGLLAAAHRGILYIDEVNLLSDHLVDLLLDAAAMGRNHVEREGISVSHPAEFLLIGTMNPEEGEIRPQLLDRFGLMVEAESGLAPADRAEVVRRRLAFEADPAAFLARWSAAEERERRRVLDARARLHAVRVPEPVLEAIALLCAEAGVDGLRGDLVIYKTARALAAYDGRDEVELEDVRAAAVLALPHRQRRLPFQQPQLDESRLDEVLNRFEARARSREPGAGQEGGDDAGGQEAAEGGDGSEEGGPPGPAGARDGPEGRASGPAGGDGDGTGAGEEHAGIGVPVAVPPPDLRHRQARRPGDAGRRLNALGGAGGGRYVGARIPRGRPADLALDATLRAAAPYQVRRRVGGAGEGLRVERWDLREKVRMRETGTLFLFVVDASGSMGAYRRMEAVKGAILSLLLDAYQRRDRVGMVTFRGTGAQLVLPPTDNVDLAHRYLEDLPTGGRTPLAAGLRLAAEVLERLRARDPDRVAVLVLVSDGRANEGPEGEDPVLAAQAAAADLRSAEVPALVLDTEGGPVRLGLARTLAGSLGADYVALDGLLTADRLAAEVRSRRRR